LRPSALGSRLRVQCPPDWNVVSLRPGAVDAVRPRHYGKRHHAVGVADVERVAEQRHAERLVQSLHEGFTRFGDAIAIPSRKQRDAVRADAERSGRRIVACIA